MPIMEPGFTFIDPAVHRSSMASPDITGPQSILKDLLASENTENANLVEILAFIKPNCHQIVSLVRGAFTKNSKLLNLLKACLNQFSHTNPNSKEILKHFVNEFILWLDNDCLVLFRKYSLLIDNMNALDADITGDKLNIFVKPVLNCQNYISFMENCQLYIRNPFIVDKLTYLKQQLCDLLENHAEKSTIKQLNTIKFNRVKSFHSDLPVSSCFTLDQIMLRSNNDVLYVNGQQVEVCLLDLLKNAKSSLQYNALAILGIETDCRSLIYPPFRINELTCKFDGCSIVLAPINYTAKQHESTLVITCRGNDKQLLSFWYEKLTQIFPSVSSSPLSSHFGAGSMNGLGISVHEPFAIKSADSKPQERDFKSSQVKHKQTTQSGSTNGVSITKEKLSESLQSHSITKGVYSTSKDHGSNAKDHSTQPTQPYTQLSTAVDNPSTNQQSLRPPVAQRKSSNSSSLSNKSNDSQYEKSLKIMNKTLSLTSLCLVGNKVEEEKRVKLIKTPGLACTPCLDVNRPVSSQAEVGYSDEWDVSPASLVPTSQDINLQPVDVEISTRASENGTSSMTSENGTNARDDSGISSIEQNYNPAEKFKFKSVPDLSYSKPSKSLYTLATGSAVDISNFGKDYQPSFKSDDLADMSKRNVSTTSVNSTSSKKSKNKFFGLFKNSSKSSLNVAAKSSTNTTKTPSKNTKELTIDTSIAQEDAGAPLSASSVVSELPRSRSQLPSPFALPSSTSTYFFKQYAQNAQNSSSTPAKDTVEEAVLNIPSDLKQRINDADDVYISPSSSNAMTISKWKNNFGKWEMLTVNEKLFIKIVINYETSHGWIIAFKELDDETDEPILLVDLNECSIRQSSAVDIQINGTNSITAEKLLTLIRCNNGLVDEVADQIKLAIRCVNGGNLRSLKSSNSNGTISPINSELPSKSSTLTSISTYRDPQKPELVTLEEDPSSGFERLMLMKDMTIRLQKNVESYAQVNNPACWNIISMYSLTVYLITKNEKNYYNLILKNQLPNSTQDYFWMIEENYKYSVLERIGKAGLLVKGDNNELFMIECRGKKEFNTLIQIL